MNRTVIHIDIDFFFAQSEQLSDPSLTNEPFAVGGFTARSGIIASANYIAREQGVRSAMPSHKARELCPKLIIIKPRMEVYKSLSKKVFRIFRRYTPNVEPIGLDEAYLEFTGSNVHIKDKAKAARQIIKDIYDETGLVASGASAPNKLLAKLACSSIKPNGFLELTRDKVDEFMYEMPIEAINGVGKITKQKLHQQNIRTTKDVRECSQAFIIDLLGDFGRILHDKARGLDDSDVISERIRKSIGAEKTLKHDVFTLVEAAYEFESLFEELCHRINTKNCYNRIKKIKAKIKFSDFQTTSMETEGLLFNYQNIRELTELIWMRSEGRAIRLIGLSVILQQADNPRYGKQLELDLYA